MWRCWRLVRGYASAKLLPTGRSATSDKGNGAWLCQHERLLLTSIAKLPGPIPSLSGTLTAHAPVLAVAHLPAIWYALFLLVLSQRLFMPGHGHRLLTLFQGGGARALRDSSCCRTMDMEAGWPSSHTDADRLTLWVQRGEGERRSWA